MKYKNEFKVGVSVFLAALVFIFGVRYFQDIPIFRGSYELVTSFEEVNGLIAGNAVEINGVNVGDVSKITLDQAEQKVRVRLRLSNDVTVPEGSVVKLVGLSQFGGVHLSIQPGPTSNPMLDPGDYIPSQQSQGMLGSLTEQAAPLLSRTDSLIRKINLTASEVQEQLAQPNSDLRSTLANLQATTNQLNMLLENERPEIKEIISNTQAITGEMREFTDESADTLSVTVQKLNRSATHLESTLTQVDQVAASLNEVTTRINQGEGTLGRLATDPSLYHRVDSLTTNLNNLVNDFQENPRRYLRHIPVVELF